MLNSFGRAVLRGISFAVLVLIRGRRVFAALGALLVVGLIALAALTPHPSAPAPTATAVAAAPSPGGANREAAIQRVIQMGNAAQAQALASGDPAVLRATATGPYFQQVAKTNQNLKQGGIEAIQLVGLEWQQITVSGDVATAIVYETWLTQLPDASKVQSRDLNVYGLVRQNGTWLIASDEHPGEQTAA